MLCYGMLVATGVTLLSVSISAAPPASWSQWNSRYGVTTPIIHAAPAFDSPRFDRRWQRPAIVGVRQEDPLGDSSGRPQDVVGTNDVEGNVAGTNDVEGNVTGGGDEGSATDENLGVYDFAYDVAGAGGGHSRQESRDAQGTVTGSYTITLADGRRRRVDYIADANGFRAKVDTNEPGTGNLSPADVDWTSTAPQPHRPVGEPTPGGQRPTPGDQRPIPGGQRPTPGDQRPIPGGQRPTPGDQRPIPGDQHPTPDDQPQRPPTPANEIPRPPTHITSRPPPPPAQPVDGNDAFDEPRTPHHPPQGFVPPNPSTPLVFSAVSNPWAAPPTTYFHMIPSHTYYVQRAYPALSQRRYR